jgi:hypothetical protein
MDANMSMRAAILKTQLDTYAPAAIKVTKSRHRKHQLASAMDLELQRIESERASRQQRANEGAKGRKKSLTFGLIPEPMVQAGPLGAYASSNMLTHDPNKNYDVVSMHSPSVRDARAAKALKGPASSPGLSPTTSPGSTPKPENAMLPGQVDDDDDDDDGGDGEEEKKTNVVAERLSQPTMMNKVRLDKGLPTERANRARKRARAA